MAPPVAEAGPERPAIPANAATVGASFGRLGAAVSARAENTATIGAPFGTVTAAGETPPAAAAISVDTMIPMSLRAQAVSATTATFRAYGKVTRFSFPAEWDADRQEAIRLLTDLPRHLQEASEAFRLIEVLQQKSRIADRGGIGGNHPPEGILDPPSADDIATDARVACDVLLTELTREEPRLSSIQLGGRTLQRVAGWLKRIAGWLADRGGTIALGMYASNPDQLMTDLHALETKINAVLIPFSHLFSLVHQLL